MLCDALKHGGKLETLKLGWCKIGGGDGAAAIADLIMFNTSLVTVGGRVTGGGGAGAGRGRARGGKVGGSWVSRQAGGRGPVGKVGEWVAGWAEATYG